MSHARALQSTSSRQRRMDNWLTVEISRNRAALHRKASTGSTLWLTFNDEGPVSAHWGVFDTLGVMLQLRLVP